MLRTLANLIFFTLSRELGRIVAFEVETETLYLNSLRRKKQVKKHHRHGVLKTCYPRSFFFMFSCLSKCSQSGPLVGSSTTAKL